MIALPDTSTEVAIATTTLSSAATNITFSSISGSYTDLRLVLTGTADSSTVYVQFNNDTASNYSMTRLDGDGSTASSTRQTSLSECRLYNMQTTTPSLHTLDIFSYAGSTNKTLLATTQSDNNGSGNIRYYVQLWRNTAAITSVKLFFYSGTGFATGTTATLYGIL